MQIPILNGVFMDTSPDFRIQYPINMIPVVKDTGISKGYLRPSEGIEPFTFATQGIDRGAIFWEDLLYRVNGSKLISVEDDGAINEIGEVGNLGNFQCPLDYSFDYLGVISDFKFYLYDGVTFQQVTDPDIGLPIDFLFLDGYFVLTDGEFIYVTELNDPFSIVADKYGSSEIDPDPVLSLQKLRNELYALNRYTIEVFNNIGGSGFPFQRENGGQIQKGTIGTETNCVFEEGNTEYIAFMGGGKNEGTGIHLGIKGYSKKISTSEIDIILSGYTDLQLSQSLVEARYDRDQNFLYIHLPDQTLVYDGRGSIQAGQPIWFILNSAINPLHSMEKYRARNFIKAYNSWICGDPTTGNIGKLSYDISSQYGDKIGWGFNTIIVYNNAYGAIFNWLELVALTGSVGLGINPKMFTDWSFDGINWSIPQERKVGVKGERSKRLRWWRQGRMKDRRIQRFYGTSDSRISVARLEAELEPLSV